MTVSAISGAGPTYQAQTVPSTGSVARGSSQKSAAPQDNVHLSAAAAAHLKGGDPDGDGD